MDLDNSGLAASAPSPAQRARFRAATMLCAAGFGLLTFIAGTAIAWADLPFWALALVGCATWFGRKPLARMAAGSTNRRGNWLAAALSLAEGLFVGAVASVLFQLGHYLHLALSVDTSGGAETANRVTAQLRIGGGGLTPTQIAEAWIILALQISSGLLAIAIATLAPAERATRRIAELLAYAGVSVAAFVVGSDLFGGDFGLLSALLLTALSVFLVAKPRLSALDALEPAFVARGLSPFDAARSLAFTPFGWVATVSQEAAPAKA
jgi:hypothetical protein